MTDSLLALLPKARRRWAATDPVLAGIAKKYPPVKRSLDSRDPFASLVSSIAHQQVSIQAGASIVRRAEEACGGAVTPESILKLGPDEVRACGFSRPKVAYVLDLAERVATRTVDFERLASAPDAEVIDTLTEVKGIGVWTAKMFLLFHLHRPDVLPFEDLGIQVGVARLYKVPRSRAKAKLAKLGPAWSPYSSVASLTIWNWRRATEAQASALR